jgi:hypothetical protein
MRNLLGHVWRSVCCLCLLLGLSCCTAGVCYFILAVLKACTAALLPAYGVSRVLTTCTAVLLVCAGTP